MSTRTTNTGRFETKPIKEPKNYCDGCNVLLQTCHNWVHGYKYIQLNWETEDAINNRHLCLPCGEKLKQLFPEFLIYKDGDHD